MDLGLRITNDLKASAHCAYVFPKTNRVLGLINRTMVYRSPDFLTRLYKSLVRTHLEYCVSAWSLHYLKDRVRLERVQHRFPRLLPGLKSLEYGRRLERLRLADSFAGREEKFPKDCLPFREIHSSVQVDKRPFKEADKGKFQVGHKKVFFTKGREQIDGTA